MSSAFLDTNILVYAFSDGPKSDRAGALLADRFVLSVQSLNEFAHLARRKLGFTWEELDSALAAIRALCRYVVVLDLDIHRDALRIARRYGFNIYDALMISAALAANCPVFYSEDLNSGQIIDARLRVEDPFSPA